MHRWIFTLIALSLPAAASACPFCGSQGKALTDELTGAETDLVVYGRLVSSDETAQTSRIEIEKVLKDDARRGKGKEITIKKYLPPDAVTAKDRILLFCEIYKGDIDSFRGIIVRSGSSLPQYLQDAVKAKAKPTADRLKFFFGYLDDAETEVSLDAYREFAAADYKDFAPVAKTFPAEKVIKWLKAADTQPFRIGLYASMLGHCGTGKDAAVITTMLADKDRRAGSGVDGLLAAHVMLKQEEGWKALVAALSDTKEDFTFRYAALRAVRFLKEYRGDLVKTKDVVAAVSVLLKQEDIADMAIEDLRKWKQWDAADRVLAVVKTPAYKEVLVIRRSVLRYCLQCPDHAGAAAYVASRRKEDPDLVKDAEELLKLDAETPKATKEDE